MIVFVDQITFLSLFRIVLLPEIDTVWFFEPISPMINPLVSILKKFRILPHKFYHIEYNVSHIKNESGESAFLQLFDNSREICLKIRKEYFDNNSIILSMSSEWSYNKTILFIEKIIEANLSLEYLRIGMVQWIMKEKLHMPMSQALLIIGRQPWAPYIKQYADNKISLKFYGYRLNVIKGINIWLKLSAIFKRIPFLLIMLVRKSVTFCLNFPKRILNTGRGTQPEKQAEPVIGIHYYHRKISFDPTERSEFFFLNGKKIPYSSLLVYNYNSAEPLSAEIKRELKDYGVKLIGNAPGVASWYPRKRMFLHIARLISKILFLIVISRKHDRKEPLFLFASLSVLSVYFAYWYDFFQANHIAVNIGTNNTHIGQNMALDALDSVSVAYQYSSSTLLKRNMLRGSGENVQFVFSPCFEQIWQDEIHSPKVFVSTGFIHDKSLYTLKDHHRVSELKNSLRKKGAEFIISFFDENSFNRWDIAASDEDVAQEYEVFLKWVIDDPTLGIIFKPKKSQTLFQRIDRLSDLLDKARQTGRCKFLMSNTLYGDIFPAEAALASDLCIGKITGVTAGVEAFLAGVTTVFTDVVGYRNHPFYSWGDGKVVFDNLELLKKAVDQYRKSPEIIKGFGDLSPAISEIDPFQDGNAADRLESYIGSIFRAVKHGATKSEALTEASMGYKKQWGDEYAVSFNGDKQADTLSKRVGCCN